MILYLPVPTCMLLLFIAHLHASKLASASIVSTVSALGYFHKINGFTEPASSILVSKLLAGARNIGAVPDDRLPVTLPMLGRLISAIPVVFTSGYKCRMLKNTSRPQRSARVVAHYAPGVPSLLESGIDGTSISPCHWQLFTAR